MKSALAGLACWAIVAMPAMAHESNCAAGLEGVSLENDSSISPDDRAVRWLEDLLGPVTNWPVNDARAAVAQLLAGSRESPVSEGAVSNNADLQVHREQLAELMREVSDPVAVGRALQEELNRRDGSTQRRQKKKEEIELDLNFRIAFGEVPPGSFSAWLKDISHFIVLPQPISMQLAPLTQWQLGEVLPALRTEGQNNSSPAVNLTGREAQDFVYELNRWARTNDPRLLRIIPGHQPNWRYSLPDAWEWMYVASNLATNSSDAEAWRKNDLINSLTLGGFTSVGLAAHLFRDDPATVNWEVGELDPMIINGYEFHDFGGNVRTFLNPNPFVTINQPTEDDGPTPKLLFRAQTPRIIPKELSWFNREVLKDNSYDNSMPVSKVYRSYSYDKTFLEFVSVNATLKHPDTGIRLITFKVDAETDARLDPDTPVDEKATFARLGAAYLIYHIQIEAVAHNKALKARRKRLLQVVPAALKDWKQGRRNPEFEKNIKSDSLVFKIFQHPAIDLRRLAIEVEAQIKTREVMP